MMYVDSPGVLHRSSSPPLQKSHRLALSLLDLGLTGEQRHLVPGVDQAAVVLHWAVALGDHQVCRALSGQHAHTVGGSAGC